MSKLTIAKFGGSAIGIDGEGIPEIVKRIKEIQQNSKLVVVCSAPLTMVEENLDYRGIDRRRGFCLEYNPCIQRYIYIRIACYYWSFDAGDSIRHYGYGP